MTACSASVAAEPATPLPTEQEIMNNPVEMPPLRFPQAAVDAKVEGWVRLRVTLFPDGRVKDAVVVKAEPPGWFEEAAMEGVKRWRFKAPGREMSFDLDVEFKMK
jgi:protein TonB